jgi:plasmid stabilization system protein ParE
MASSVRILPSAATEIDDIVTYLASRNGSAAAKFLDGLDRQIELLRSGSVDFAPCALPELASLGYHACRVRPYIVLYYHEADAIVIAHVFHQRRDYARLCLPPERDS